MERCTELGGYIEEYRIKRLSKKGQHKWKV